MKELTVSKKELVQFVKQAQALIKPFESLQRFQKYRPEVFEIVDGLELVSDAINNFIENYLTENKER